MTNLNYEVVEGAMGGHSPSDAVSDNGYWIPLKRNQVIGTDILDGYRCIVVNSVRYQFHRSIHEIGRPQLLDEILDLMKVLNSA